MHLINDKHHLDMKKHTHFNHILLLAFMALFIIVTTTLYLVDIDKKSCYRKLMTLKVGSESS